MADGGLGLVAAMQQQMQRQGRQQTMPRVGAYTNQNSMGGGFFGDQGLAEAQQAYMNGDPAALDQWSARSGASLSYPYGNPNQEAPAEVLPPGVHRAGSDMGWGIKAGDLVMNDGQGGGRGNWKPYTGDAGAGGGVLGGAVGGASGGASGGGFGGALGDAVGGAYQNIIANGGALGDAAGRSGVINRESATIARGTNDAIQSAREDAVRRGDTTGSTLGTVEGRIRAQGASNQADAAANRTMQMQEADFGRLSGALGGATGLISAQAQNALAGQELGLNALNVYANLAKSGQAPPAYNY